MNGTAYQSCFVRPNWRLICLHLCSVVRDLALDQIDPSLAIGFYCHDKGEVLSLGRLLRPCLSFSNLIFYLHIYVDDFDDFCSRASELVEKANGAPLFTVAQSIEPLKQMYNQDDGLGCSGSSMVNHDDLDGSGEAGEEEWQIL
jgi:cysteine protease ATG4